jgi:phosphohistidine phosphatase SixA
MATGTCTGSVLSRAANQSVGPQRYSIRSGQLPSRRILLVAFIALQTGTAVTHHMPRLSHLRRHWLVMVLGLSVPIFALSQTIPPDSVATALRAGGYVLVMRHASSPRPPPDAALANADNIQRERQLDEVGRTTAQDMGVALRRLGIPIGEVLSSPTYRALETVRLARLGDAKPLLELGDSGASMQSQSDGKRGAWLRARSQEKPQPGRNTVIVTHYPNIMEAFPDFAAALADGEALVFHPDGNGDAPLVARVKIEEWKGMRAAP